jgi:predicted MFS family arabinose efflux permease
LSPITQIDTIYLYFDTGFGVAWLAGSIAFGLLYDRSLRVLVTVSIAAQLLSLPLFVLGHHASRHSRG